MVGTCSFSNWWLDWCDLIYVAYPSFLVKLISFPYFHWNFVHFFLLIGYQFLFFKVCSFFSATYQSFKGGQEGFLFPFSRLVKKRLTSITRTLLTPRRSFWRKAPRSSSPTLWRTRLRLYERKISPQRRVIVKMNSMLKKSRKNLKRQDIPVLLRRCLCMQR